MKEFIKECKEKGIELICKDGRSIAYKTSAGPIDRKTLKYIKENKAVIIRYLMGGGISPESAQNKSDDNGDRYEEFELTDIQAAYYAGRQTNYKYGGTGCYTYIEIKTDRLDIERFNQAWYQTILRHDMLHARVTEEGRQQVIKEVEKPEAQVYEIEAKKDLLQDCKEVIKMRKELYAYDFGANAYPMHMFIIGQGKKESIVHFCVDMLIADFISINIILSDVFKYYNRGDFGDSLPVDISFKKIVSERKQKRAGQSDREYWMKKIDEEAFVAPKLPVKSDEISLNKKVTFGRKRVILDKEKYEKLRQISRDHGLTVSNMVLAAYAGTISRWTGESKLCINVTVMQRSEKEKELVGDFTAVNLLALDIKDESLGEFAKRVQKTLLTDMAHMSFSGVDVMREIGKTQGEKVIFPVVYTSTLGTDNSHEDILSLNITEGISRTPQVLIDCQVLERGEGLEIHWDIRNGVFEDYIIDDMWGNFEETIKTLIVEGNSDNIKRGEIKEGYYEKRNKYNTVTKDFPKKMLYEGFLKNVKNNPDKTAIIYDGKIYTYSQCATMAAALKNKLKGAGVGTGDNVAILYERGPIQIAGVLATILCGAAYVPVDVKQPFKRQERIIIESDAKVILASESNYQVSDSFAGKVIFPEKIISEYEKEKTDGCIKLCPEDGLSNDEPAYIIFTSGTTGLPKGVMITHSQAANTITDMNSRFEIGSEDVFIGITKLSFDLSVYDIFGCFDAGAALVIPTESNATNVSNWIELIGKYGVTVWNSVPALFKMLVNEAQEGEDKCLHSIRRIMLSGDVIDPSLPDVARNMFENYKMISLGGATEGAIWSIWWDITKHDTESVIPYGVALTNQQMYVVDVFGNQVPDGVKGEIAIGGMGVASGYYGDKELTGNKFVYNNKLDNRLFMTGDVGYVRNDGVVMICGRKDNQIKINGNRIEIGEIESVVRQTKEVAECAVINHRHNKKSNKLILYVAPKKEEVTNTIKTDIDYTRLKQDCNRYFDDVDRTGYMKWRDESDSVALADMLAFFREIDVFTKETEYTRKQIHLACGELEEFHSIIDRFLRALTEAGIVEQMITDTGETYYRLNEVHKKYLNRDGIWDRFMETASKIGYGDTLMQYQRESGKHILEQVRGEITGISLFFPEGSTDVAIAAYRENLINKRLNYVVAHIMDKLSVGGADILEIGAGVGGTTTTVLEKIKDKDIRYCFTDVSKFFLNKAKEVYAEYNFIDYRILDVNKNYEEQGFEKGKYDVILCANVLHNSSNIGENLVRIKKLLKPDGYLIIIEATGESYLLTTSLELKGGLDGFSDHRANGIDVFTSREKWIELISEAGYEAGFALPNEDDVLSKCGQSVLLCHNTAPNNTASAKDEDSLIKAGSSKGIKVEKIEKYMASRLPDYMIPEKIEIIDEIPLTSNGKIDRKKLMDIYEKKASIEEEKKDEYKVLDSIEESIAAIWREVLGTDKVSGDDNFYYLGGDSLLITQVVSKMRKNIPGLDKISWDELMHDALNNPTISGLAGVLRASGYFSDAKVSDSNVMDDNVCREKTDNNQNKEISDSSLVIYRDNPSIRKTVQAYFHAGTGRLADYGYLIPDVLDNTPEDMSIVGFTYGNDTEYLSVTDSELIAKRAQKYASILLSMRAEKYILTGYCVGGFLALETAKILLEAGADVYGVIMIASEPATHMISNQLLMELSYGAAVGLDMKKTGIEIDLEEMKKCLADILDGVDRNVKNSELIRLAGTYEHYGELFTNLIDMTHEERLRNIFDKAGGDRFNGNESTFAMFTLLYNIFEHTFKGMMNYSLDGVYLGKVIYLNAPTDNSFYPVMRKNKDISQVCIGELTVKNISGTHATCLHKDNYKDVLSQILNLCRDMD